MLICCMLIKIYRTPSQPIGYGFFYFLGLSLRNVTRALSFLQVIKRVHVAVWPGIKKHKPRRKTVSKKRISEYVDNEIND